MISSTLIRKNIRLGKIKLVNKLLNRHWCIEGKIIKGKRGRKIGFPTCNMNLSSYVIPKLEFAVNVKSGKFNRKVSPILVTGLHLMVKFYCQKQISLELIKIYIIK